MARKPHTFTKAELDYVVNSIQARTLNSVVSLLLNSKAPASPEIGNVVMHLANGANSFGPLAEEAQKAVFKSLGESPVAAERFAELQVIINGQTE